MARLRIWRLIHLSVKQWTFLDERVSCITKHHYVPFYPPTYKFERIQPLAAKMGLYKQ